MRFHIKPPQQFITITIALMGRRGATYCGLKRVVNSDLIVIKWRALPIHEDAFHYRLVLVRTCSGGAEVLTRHVVKAILQYKKH